MGCAGAGAGAGGTPTATARRTMPPQHVHRRQLLQLRRGTPLPAVAAAAERAPPPPMGAGTAGPSRRGEASDRPFCIWVTVLDEKGLTLPYDSFRRTQACYQLLLSPSHAGVLCVRALVGLVGILRSKAMQHIMCHFSIFRGWRFHFPSCIMLSSSRTKANSIQIRKIAREPAEPWPAGRRLKSH